MRSKDAQKQLARTSLGGRNLTTNLTFLLLRKSQNLLFWLLNSSGHQSLPYSLLEIYNFRNIVHFLKCMLQVGDNAVFWQNVLLYFESDPLSLFQIITYDLI